MKTLVASLLIGAMAFTPVWAADSIDHSGQASKHSVLASVEGAAITTSVASAVVAAPVIVAGVVTVSAIEASQNVAKKVHDHHVAHTKPLKITTRVITRDPPPSEIVVEQTINH